MVRPTTKASGEAARSANAFSRTATPSAAFPRSARMRAFSSATAMPSGSAAANRFSSASAPSASFEARSISAWNMIASAVAPVPSAATAECFRAFGRSPSAKAIRATWSWSLGCAGASARSPSRIVMALARWAGSGPCE